MAPAKPKKTTGSKELLGDGLQDMLSNVIGLAPENEVSAISVDKIFPNRRQPRLYFDPEEMARMVESVRDNGILQPVIVRPVGDRYEIVAGERRWRAAREVGISDIPVVIKDVSREKAADIALIENLQRSDLNPMEKAVAYDSLVKNHKLTQEEVAERLRVDRSSVANIIRLLELPDEAQDGVSRGTISMGHARALLGAGDAKLIGKLLGRIVSEGLSVRQVEGLVSGLKGGGKAARRGSKNAQKSAVILDIEEKLRRELKTKVALTEKGGRGKLVVEFYDNNQLGYILERLGVSA